MYAHKYIKLFIKKSDSYNVITRIKGKLAVPTIKHHKVSKKKMPCDVLKLLINKFKT